MALMLWFISFYDLQANINYLHRRLVQSIQNLLHSTFFTFIITEKYKNELSRPK